MNSRTYHGEGDHLATWEREAASLKRQPLTLARLADAALPLRDKTGIAGKKKTEQISTLEQEAAGGAFVARNCAEVAQELKL